MSDKKNSFNDNHKKLMEYYNTVLPEERGVVEFVVFQDNPAKRKNNGKGWTREHKIIEGLQVENLVFYINEEGRLTSACKHKKGALILEILNEKSRQWDELLINLYRKKKQEFNCKNTVKNLKIDVTQEEFELIEEYRALNYSGKKLVKQTLETLRATAAGSGQNKNKIS